ncbi:Wzz/FepE/Etk N-terminal domain-containing protein [Emcibacter nanhaiensis]|uniref:LPS O-antigen length regulator n=1 Tax=Emcibacter nanhaiensis TaxID=1505037 RepID=A0A501PAP3_9PROT|nr:Wzz/FepE/Etk N-terminal domain-containing protein [Emcibacter nanhaiensis]TPD57423.1 hypothetical protein FIV46_14970 [Emcibacter nanhaiensis]
MDNETSENVLADRDIKNLGGRTEIDDVDLYRLFNVLWSGKYIILAFVFVSAVISVLYSLSLPNMYRASVLVAPSDRLSSNQVSGASSRLQGLAGLAGLGGSTGDVDTIQLALQVMQSRYFLLRFADKYNLDVPLFAGKEWQRDSNVLIIDENIYDTKKEKWLRVVKGNKGSEPSDFEVFERLSENLQISRNEENGFISISMESLSPYLAKQWVDAIVYEINNEIRQKHILTADRNIKYIEGKLAKTDVAAIRNIFFELVEKEIQNKLMAETADEYVFMVVDPAVVPEKKSRPARAVICIVGVFLGGCLGLVAIFVRNFIRNYPGRQSGNGAE